MEPSALMVFAPVARRWRRRSGSEGERAEAAARAARRGRLETVQKLCTDPGAGQCPDSPRQDLGTGAVRLILDAFSYAAGRLSEINSNAGEGGRLSWTVR